LGNLDHVRPESLAGETAPDDDLVDPPAVKTTQRDGRNLAPIQAPACEHVGGAACCRGEDDRHSREPRIAEHGSDPAQIRTAVRVVSHHDRRGIERHIDQGVR
jgi:hypothetical protein